MKPEKRLGIWMDRSVALIMELKENGSIITSKIESTSEPYKKNLDFSTSNEQFLIQKKQNKLSFYYKRLIIIIKDFSDVVLLGSTDALHELLFLLNENLHYEHTKIEAIAAEKMTEKQLQEFVKDYFEEKKLEFENIHEIEYAIKY